jgi:hypothetical protein
MRFRKRCTLSLEFKASSHCLQETTYSRGWRVWIATYASWANRLNKTFHWYGECCEKRRLTYAPPLQPIRGQKGRRPSETWLLLPLGMSHHVSIGQRGIAIFAINMKPMRWILLSLILSSTTLHSQSIYVHFTNGTSLTYNVNDVRSTRTSGNTFQMFLTNGTTFQWDLASIIKYQFEPGPIGVGEISSHRNAVGVYPNPSHGVVTIEHDLEQASHLIADIIDVKGIPIRRLFDGHANSGLHRLHWDGRDGNGESVPSGIYLIRLQRPTYLITEQILIAR